jgi:hypothetical protein
MLFTRLQYHIQSTFGRVDYIVGLDSRGFLIGPTLATRLKGLSFVPYTFCDCCGPSYHNCGLVYSWFRSNS